VLRSEGQVDAELLFYSNHALKETIKLFLYSEQIQIRPLLCSASIRRIHKKEEKEDECQLQCWGVRPYHSKVCSNMDSHGNGESFS